MMSYQDVAIPLVLFILMVSAAQDFSDRAVTMCDVPENRNRSFRKLILSQSSQLRRALMTGVVAALAAMAAPGAAEATSEDCWQTDQHIGLFCNDGGEATVCEWGDACVMSCGEGVVDVPCE